MPLRVASSTGPRWRVPSASIRAQPTAWLRSARLAHGIGTTIGDRRVVRALAALSRSDDDHEGAETANDPMPELRPLWGSGPPLQTTTTSSTRGSGGPGRELRVRDDADQVYRQGDEQEAGERCCGSDLGGEMAAPQRVAVHRWLRCNPREVACRLSQSPTP